MGIGQNIRNLRTDAGMSQEELAERLDPPYTRPAVTAWESGRAKPRMDTVVQIAELFGVSVADLMGHGGVEPRRSSRRVPVRLMGSVHAGEWSEAVPDGVVAVIPEEVADRHPGSYLLRVEGTCMDNAYPEGCMVLVDPTLEPWAGCAVVARVGDDVVLRRYHAGASTLLLVADSHSGDHPDLIFTGDGPEVMLEGVVVWAQSARDLP